MSTTILVTGGAGFIGSNFIHYLVEAHPDWSVINLDKLTYAGNLDNLKDVDGRDGYRFVQGDICDRDCVAPLVAECDYVVNFALDFRLNTVGFNANADPKDIDVVPVAPETSITQINDRVEQIRSVTITLSARTPEQDPRHPLINPPIQSFKVFHDPLAPPSPLGAARVRTLRATVLVPNIAYEGY